jgi:1,4-alpha-glucan branching enzyme
MAKASLKPVTFKLKAPQAKKVSLAGTFNNWDIKSHLAKKGLKGTWSTKVNLKPGRYEYKFVVDGSWINDPTCNASVGNAFGSQNSLVEVK